MDRFRLGSLLLLGGVVGAMSFIGCGVLSSGGRGSGTVGPALGEAQALEGVGNWDVTSLGSNEYVGRFISLAILPSGEPAMSFYGDTDKSIEFSWLEDGAWGTSTVATDADRLSSTSLAILSSDHPAISYSSDGALQYTWFDGNAWHRVVIDDGEGAGLSGINEMSMVILPSGQPAISYGARYISQVSDMIFIEDRLKYAWFDGEMWHVTTVDDGGSAGFSNSLATLPTGQPVIAYSGDRQLKFAAFKGEAWEVSTVDSEGVWGGNGLAILPSGQPAISYCDAGDNQKYAWSDGTEWHTTVVDAAGNVGEDSSLAVLPSGQPVISYCLRQPDDDLKFAWREGDQWHTTIVDAEGEVGRYSSLAILPTGQPAICYFDDGNGDVKYAVGTPTYHDSGER